MATSDVGDTLSCPLFLRNMGPWGHPRALLEFQMCAMWERDPCRVTGGPGSPHRVHSCEKTGTLESQGPKL